MSASATLAAPPQVHTYTFIRNENRWFLSLPAYRNTAQRMLNELIEGAQSLLNTIARGNDTVHIQLDTQPFEGAERLELVELCDRGGGYYFLDTCNGRKIQRRLWVCDLTLLVFGDIPQGLYFRTVR